jgi:hypothetical protein
MSGTVSGSVQAGPPERIRLLLGATIVTAGGRDWTGRDLVTAGALSGRWRTLESDLAVGLACLENWAPPHELVREGLRDFRYARRLISADEFSDWLRRRELTQKELAEAVGRRLAREHDGEPSAAGRLDLRHDALAALPAEAVYTGALLDCAEWLTDRILCLADGPAPMVEPTEVRLLLARERELMASEVVAETDSERRARAELILAASATYDGHIAEACSAKAVAKLLQHKALDWLRFELIGFTCTAAGAAAEIAALLREGTPPETITEVSGVPAEQLHLYLEEVPAAIQGWLGSAVPGAVIGPVAEQDSYRTWLVRSRQSPDPEDPLITDKARAQIAEEYMRRRRAGRVKWHERH